MPPSEHQAARGTLILVVGPSGAGKDSLIHGAREKLAGNDAFVFARRCITRPADAGGEPHEPVSVAGFDALECEGGFLLSWWAHGLSYGIPSRYEADLATGRSVIANVSRTVIADARARFGPLAVLHVTASPYILARRLAGRGRETADDQAARLERAVDARLAGDDVMTIRNEGSLEQGVDAFLRCLDTLPHRVIPGHAAE